MAKTGIFGGTFNPVHNGHVKIAESFKKQLQLDRLIIIPSKVPTHKSSPDLASAEDRINMCRLAFEGTGTEVSSIEISRESESYSYYTLLEIKEQYPDDEIFMLVGEDMFLTLLLWYNAEEVIRLCTPCVAVRSVDGCEHIIEYGEKLIEAGGSYRLIESPFVDISSTEIRERIQHNMSIDTLVPDSVGQYINEKRLYER